ncbi:MAG: double-strand break repair helicase AddA [Micropepsaceae bacterium]
MTASGDHEQIKATDPAQSAWVAANAGSGKTHVLVNRIARLLLSGSAPDRLLCLTFTKAAAAEMSIRLFDQLGRWALLPDADLRRELFKICNEEANDALVMRARKLFANALESPGGLRIQTIHAFCERLLKRFPLEANVAPQFSVLDEQATQDLLNEARDDVLRSASGGDAQLELAISELTEFSNDEQFDTLIRNIISERSWIGAFIEANAAIGLEAAVLHSLGVPEQLTEGELVADTVRQMVPSDLKRLAAALRQGAETDKNRASQFEALANAPSADTLQGVVDCLLTQKGERRARPATKGALDQGQFVGELIGTYTDLALELNRKRNALFIARHTTNLLRLAAAIYVAYRHHKNLRAALDYDDLINRTVGLFNSPGASWVLYKLDGGIDHVLVDEAQDTSPHQWEIIKRIAEEFFAGIGAERENQSRERTVFAVGDIKQSIMSFQGARPLEFKNTRELLERRATDANARFEAVQLTKSFRSAPRVLELVDEVFADPAAADGVMIDEIANRHEAVRGDMEGLVELWPVIRAPDRPERVAWDAPRDRVTADHPAVTLAEKIARRVADWLGEGVPVFDKVTRLLRPMTAGDVMILVRRRGTLASEIIRQLKRKSIPVAGADRLVLAQHIAVMDLIAVGRFALLPSDDLTLAAVLRGPLCGLSDEALFEISYGRNKTSIWTVLCEKREDPRWSGAWMFLDQVWSMADHVQPFEFYSTILSANGGWHKMMTRLGHDAADPIEEFMNAALDFGRINTPSLEAFLHSIEQAETEIKRDQDRGDGAVRVLTVHGSKGLEAPVVILPDTCSTPSHGRLDSELLQAGEVPLWKLKTARDEAIRARARQTGKDERMKEYRRLLYVALTRARDRLVVCGYETSAASPVPESWYDLVKRAMVRLKAGSVPEIDGGETRYIGSVSGQKSPQAATDPTAKVLTVGLPNWVSVPAPVEKPLDQLLATRRSRQARRKDVGDSSDGLALDRGTIVHRILDAIATLASERWSYRAHEIARKELDHAPALVKAVVNEALRVRSEPGFEEIFGGNSRGEFPMRGEIQWQGRAYKFDWRLDRIVVRDTDVLVVEFKTDRVVPKADSDVRPEYLRQLALYRRAVSPLFPGKSISCGILWTVEPRLSIIPTNYLDETEHVLDP